MENLKSILRTFCENESNFGVVVYAITKGNASSPLKIDIEASALGDLKRVFMQNIKDSIIERQNVSLLNLSAADERRNAIYLYDIDIPEEFSSMENVVKSDNLAMLDLSAQSLLNIRALIIEIGNSSQQMILYKTMAPVNIFGRASYFLIKSDTRMKQINEEFLRVSPDFQLIHFNGSLLVLDLGFLERAYGFRKIIAKEAAKGIASITAKNLVENPEVLKELIGELKYARRLIKIAESSPVIKNNIPNSEIIEFCKNYPGLRGRIRFNATSDKILLDTKVSKDLFIKLLMDDLLTSELTKLHYASLAKDSIREFQPEPVA